MQVNAGLNIRKLSQWNSVLFGYQLSGDDRTNPSGQGIKVRKKAGRSSRKGMLLLCKFCARYVEESKDHTIPRACCAINGEEAGG